MLMFDISSMRRTDWFEKLIAPRIDDGLNREIKEGRVFTGKHIGQRLMRSRQTRDVTADFQADKSRPSIASSSLICGTNSL